MKQTVLSLALMTALGVMTGCGTQGTKQSLTAAPIAAEAEAQYALGRFYQGQQRYELAVDAYRKALAANPAHVSAHNGLGASLLLLGQNAQAIEQFKTGLSHQPRSAALWNNLGYAYTLSGENRLAEIALKQALDLDPSDAKTNANLAMVQEKTTDKPLQSVAAFSAPVESKQTQAELKLTESRPAESKPVEHEAVKVQALTQAKVETMSAQDQTELRKVEVMPTVVAVAPMAAQQPTNVPEPTPLAPASVQVVEVAPRVYELNMPDTPAASAPTIYTSLVIVPVKNSSMATISVPLRNEMPEVAATPAASNTTAPVASEAATEKAQLAALNSDDFVLEIRNGNGVRRMAWRTSQYLAHQGYTTKRLTNQPGFNVATTRIFYMPGYLAEAQRLLAHLPQNTTMSESLDMRKGTHVRVVLGRDMVRQQIGLYPVAPMYVVSPPVYRAAPIYVAALTR